MHQGDHSPGKPGKVREFQSGQGKVRENGKSQGKVRVICFIVQLTYHDTNQLSVNFAPVDCMSRLSRGVNTTLRT